MSYYLASEVGRWEDKSAVHQNKPTGIWEFEEQTLLKSFQNESHVSSEAGS